MFGQSLPGWITGALLSPVTGLLSAARRSRMFHPSGIVCRAEVEAMSGLAPWRATAERLMGPALVRWSSAWWKHGEWPDVLGCAIRFSEAPLRAEARPFDQDLLLATIQRPWTMPFSPLTTKQHDYLINHYYGVSPFEVAGLGRVEWRLVAESPSVRRGTRNERLVRALDTPPVSLLLEWAPYAGASRRPPAEAFSPLVRIQLMGLLDIDQNALRFDAFRAGRGLQPVGFVNSMRRATYASSRAFRHRFEPTR
jgi:hypothetical protein